MSDLERDAICSDELPSSQAPVGLGVDRGPLVRLK